MPKQVRVNIRTRVNAADIKREKREGRDVIRVPSATLPDNVVMNRILYPADEIAKSFKTLERTPAPLGHPMVGNQFVPAREPEAINGFWIGAWNENVRRENGRVLLDKVIDIEVARRHPDGAKLLEAIEKGEPVHTSTGVLVNIEAAKHKDYDGIARNMYFDHDAILLNQVGAATPAQGVGLMVNADGTRSEIDVMGVDLDEDAMKDIAESVARAMSWRIEEEEREQRLKPLIDKAMDAIRKILQGNLTARKPATGHNPNDGEDETMPISEEQFQALEQKVNSLPSGDAFTKAVTDAVAAAIKPLTDDVTAIKTNAAAAEEAERASLVDKVVKANLLDEATAKASPTATLKALAANIKAPGIAMGVFNGMAPNANDEQVAAGSFAENLKAAGGDK